MTTAIRQTVAMLIDAYRELAAGRLFWITLILSALVVVVFAAVGIDEDGVWFLWFKLGFIPVTSDQLPPDLLYKSLFSQFGVSLWLGWVAAILALVSTAGIIPNFIAAGSIDLSLCKPIGRVRLFLTRYASGLTFAGLQVAVFSLAVFLLIGIRGGDWEPRVFLAIPIVVTFFSYLFCVCAFLGLVTRSTIAAMLLTILLWCALIVINRVDDTVMTPLKVQSQLVAERRAERVANGEQIARKQIDVLASTGKPIPPSEEWPDGISDELEFANPLLASLREKAADSQETADSLEHWHTWIRRSKLLFPKTAETIALLERSLLDAEDYDSLSDLNSDDDFETPFDSEEPISMSDYNRRIIEDQSSRSPFFILGTSLGFEAFVLALCCLIFARRDF